MSLIDKQTEFLYSHLEDLYQSAEHGAFRASEFLTPRELALVRRYLGARGMGGRAVIYGGYEYAERARVYFLCDYMQSDDMPVSRLLSEYGYEDPTAILRIDGSGFR